MLNRNRGLSSMSSIVSGRDLGKLRGGYFGGIFVASIFMLLIPTAFAQYSGGGGVEGDPYLISSSDDLVALSNTEGDWDKHYLMTNDIDLTGVSVNPIGFHRDHFFSGVFDGGGHVIRNAIQNLPESDYVGIFGFLAVESEIRNLGIEGQVTGDAKVGGLAGCNFGTISNCYSINGVSGDDYVGGLVGENEGTVRYCYFRGSVSGDRKVGGLTGINDGTIDYCFSTGPVTGYSPGGLNGGGVFRVSFKKFLECEDFRNCR